MNERLKHTRFKPLCLSGETLYFNFKYSLPEIGFSVTRVGILLIVLFLALAAAPFFAGPVTVRTEDPLLWNIGY